MMIMKTMIIITNANIVQNYKYKISKHENILFKKTRNYIKINKNIYIYIPATPKGCIIFVLSAIFAFSN